MIAGIGFDSRDDFVRPVRHPAVRHEQRDVVGQSLQTYLRICSMPGAVPAGPYTGDIQ
jgi:hypothetical protein